MGHKGMALLCRRRLKTAIEGRDVMFSQEPVGRFQGVDLATSSMNVRTAVATGALSKAK